MSPALPIIMRSQRRVLTRAVARWSAVSYDPTLDALVDESGNGLHARLGSSVGPDTNDPLRLQYLGYKDLYFTGVSGNYVTTPDSVALSIAGNLDYRVRVSPDDRTPGATMSLGAKFQTAGQFSWTFWLQTDGTLRLNVAADGTTDGNAASTAAIGGTDGEYLWVRFTFEAGSVKFWTVPGVFAPPATEDYVQLGSTRTMSGGITSIFDSTSAFSLGVDLAGLTRPLTARLSRSMMYNGIGGTLVADFDASKLTEPYAAYTDPQGNVWTLNRSASGRKLAVVDRDMLLFGTDDYLEVADSPLLNFGAGDSFTVVWVGRTYGSLSLQSRISKKSVIGGGAIGYLLRASSTPTSCVFEAASATQYAGIVLSSSPTSGRASLLAGRRMAGVETSVIDSLNGSASTATDPNVVSANTDVLRIGRLSGAGTNYGDFEFFGAAIFRSALSADDLRRLAAEMGVAL